MSNSEPSVVEAVLRLEFGRGSVFLQPQEAVLLRDELQATDDPSAVRLATQIDVAVTIPARAPYMQVVRTVRVADDERQVLLDVSRKLEYMPRGSFAKLQHELSVGEYEDRGRRLVSDLVSLRLGGDHRHLAKLVDRYHVAAAGASRCPITSPRRTPS